MSMADDLDYDEKIDAMRLIDRERKYWYQAGTQEQIGATSFSINLWLRSLDRWWGSLSHRVSALIPDQDNPKPDYSPIFDEIQEFIVSMEWFGHTLLNTHTHLAGLNDDDELDQDKDYDLVNNFVFLAYQVWRVVEKQPYLYLRLFGCRKEFHNQEIQRWFATLLGKEAAAKADNYLWLNEIAYPQVKTLYSVIDNDPRYRVVFGQPDKKQLDQCVCRECLSCCSTSKGCRCKYDHHQAIECEANLDYDCDYSAHYSCSGCESGCECC